MSPTCEELFSLDKTGSSYLYVKLPPGAVMGRPDITEGYLGRLDLTDTYLLIPVINGMVSRKERINIDDPECFNPDFLSFFELL